MGAPFKTGRECLSTRARVCTRYTEHGRASITRRRVPGCFIPFAIFHILPTRVRTHRWRCLGYPLLIPKPPATTPMPMQRHLWARGTSEPFTGQENPPLFAPWEAPCSGNFPLSSPVPSPDRTIRVTLFRFVTLRGARGSSREREMRFRKMQKVYARVCACMCVWEGRRGR